MLDVTVFHSLGALAPWRQKLSALHRLSARRSPFTTLEFLEAYLANDEFLQEGRDLEVWFLVAFERAEPVGYLALRRVQQRVGPLEAAKLEFLATHDVERPHVVCRPGDEARCLEAFLRALLERKADWSMLELKQQPEGSPLRRELPAPAAAHYQRTFEAMTVSVIQVRWANLQGYLAALDKKFRANVKRQLRHLLASGEVRFLHSTDPAATPTMLDLYLDLERRSWRTRVGGTINRDPRRIAFFKSLLDPRMPFRAGVGLVLLDGLPIAGCISSSGADEILLQQVVFDDRWAKAAPGNLLFPMMVREAIETRRSSLNLMSGYAYYKERWLAGTVECRSVQVFHAGSLLFYKAIAGELRRTLRERLRGPEEAATGNVAKHASEDEAEPSAADGADEVAVDRRFVDAAVAALGAREVRTTSAAEIDSLFGLGLASGLPATRAS